MKTFEDLNFKNEITFKKWGFTGRGISRIFFPNGWGVSVIQHEYSHGGREGLYELAVLDYQGDINYSTPITNDVIGFLQPDQVTELMKMVQELPPELPIERQQKIQNIIDDSPGNHD